MNTGPLAPVRTCCLRLSRSSSVRRCFWVLCRSEFRFRSKRNVVRRGAATAATSAASDADAAAASRGRCDATTARSTGSRITERRVAILVFGGSCRFCFLRPQKGMDVGGIAHTNCVDFLRNVCGSFAGFVCVALQLPVGQVACRADRDRDVVYAFASCEPFPPWKGPEDSRGLTPESTVFPNFAPVRGKLSLFPSEYFQSWGYGPYLSGKLSVGAACSTSLSRHPSQAPARFWKALLFVVCRSRSARFARVYAETHR